MIPPSPEHAIGVFDSGAGGLTVLRALRRRLPNERFVYFGDTAHLPYGDKSPAAVLRHATSACDVLARAPLKMLVVACNTASAIALEDLTRLLAPRPVLGVIEPGAAHAVSVARRGVALLATAATLKTGAYHAAIHHGRRDLKVIATAAPVLVALAEQGWHDGPAVAGVLTRYLDELRQQGPFDCLLLGCTHFPPFRPTLECLLGDGISIVDSAEATAERTAQLLTTTGLMRPAGPGGLSTCYVSDNPERFRQLAPLFLQEEITEVRLVPPSSG